MVEGFGRIALIDKKTLLCQKGNTTSTCSGPCRSDRFKVFVQALSKELQHGTTTVTLSVEMMMMMMMMMMNDDDDDDDGGDGDGDDVDDDDNGAEIKRW